MDGHAGTGRSGGVLGFVLGVLVAGGVSAVAWFLTGSPAIAVARAEAEAAKRERDEAEARERDVIDRLSIEPEPVDASAAPLAKLEGQVARFGEELQAVMLASQAELQEQRDATKTVVAERAMLQRRFDMRVQQDEEMINTLRSQLEEARHEVAKATAERDAAVAGRERAEDELGLGQRGLDLRARLTGAWRDVHFPGGPPLAAIVALRLGDVIQVLVDAGSEQGVAVGDTLVVVGAAGGSPPANPTTAVVREVLAGFARGELTAVAPGTAHPYVALGDFVRKRP